MEKQRIEYIDAMRGMTMILVVFSHVCGLCLGDSWMGFNDVFFLFRLPCFFFISGWLFEPVREPAPTVVRKKFLVQIVPTLIFLLLLAPPPAFFHQLGTTKGGYWFTFALFVFFMLHLLTARLGTWWRGIVAIVITIAAFSYDVCYNSSFTPPQWVSNILGALSFATWRYYLFFFTGTLAKRHFDRFLRIVSTPAYITVIVLLFIATAVLTTTAPPHGLITAYALFAIGGLTGMTMVFAFFRYAAPLFAKEKVMGRSLQYIGTRTLDIYLLHYFFLPRILLPLGDTLRAYNSKPVEFAVALLIALAVVGVCLIASRLLRLSPFLARWLFGVSKPQR